MYAEHKGGFSIFDVDRMLDSPKLVAAVRGALMVAMLCAVLVSAHPACAQTETVLSTFTGGPNGYVTPSSLTSDGKGDFYGMTLYGNNGFPAIFELSPNGSGGWNQTEVYSFP